MPTIVHQTNFGNDQWGAALAEIMMRSAQAQADARMRGAQMFSEGMGRGISQLGQALGGGLASMGQSQAERDREERERQWQREQWDYTHPIQAELNKLDQAEMKIQTDPEWGPISGGDPYDVSPRQDEREAALQQIETKRNALYQMMQRQRGGGQSYGTPTFMTDPNGKVLGWVPGSSGFQYSPGQGSPGEVTPTREAIIREKAMQKASEEAAEGDIGGDFVNTRAQQWQDYYLNGTPLPAPPAKPGFVSTVKGWFSSGQQEQATASQPQPLPPVPSRDEFVVSTGVMDGNSEAAMDNLYSMLFEQNVSPDDPRASQIIDSMPLPIQRNIARMLQASGKL